MSFHDQGFWMSKVAGCLNDGDTTYGDSSRIESKRPHQWFMDGPVVDMFPNKKQAVEIPNNNLSSGMFSPNISAWGNSTSFDLFTDQITERLFDPDATRRTMNFENRSISSVVDNLNVGRKDNMDPSGSDPSFGLSITHTLEDPQSGLNYGGIRKVKVSEVKESENVVAVPTTDANDREVNNTLSNPHAYKGDKNSISMSLTYDKGDHNIISVDESYGRTRHNLISMGQSYDKEDDSLSVSQTYKEICNTTSIDQAFSKEDSKMISISQAYKNADDNSMSRDHIFSNGKDGTISVGHTHTYHKGGNYMLSVANSYKKGESSIISFGGCNDNDTPPCRLISSYELLMGQPPSLKSEAVDEKEMVKYNSDLLLTTAQTSAYRTDFVSKTKVSKKVPSNNFPSNVRSLLSTGMLDGVPVKYVAWSQEKELQGVIKGSGYLCSCQLCNFSKVINAYELERHAGCKTKHPNNHIYFENGKTVYGIVQELRSTPQNLLFDVIQTITGSPINQKSFRIWKESFLAATSELQRIYGKD